MKEIKRCSLFVIVYIIICISAYSQESIRNTKSVSEILDSLKMNGIIFSENRKRPEIYLSSSQAFQFLQKKISPEYWKEIDNPFRKSLEKLVFEVSYPPLDSCISVLETYPFDSLKISWDRFYKWKPLSFKIPVVPTVEFILPMDSVADSLNTDRLAALKHDLQKEQGRWLKDTTILIVTDTLDDVKSSYSDFPFINSGYPFQIDSIQLAVKSLLHYIEERDSSLISFSGTGKNISNVWLNSKSDIVVRYWLKNEFNDSVTVWIGNPARNTIGLYLENGVNFRRPARQENYSDAKVNVKTMDNSKLLETQKIVTKTQYWKYRSESSFLLNQASLTNWVRGGESNISFATDIIGFAEYTNKALKISSNNFIRMKLGFIQSGDQGLRKNQDIIETSSKLNHKAFGKFDFSGILLFKTQLAKGYDYPNDSVPVSKVMNPGIITVGFGLDYKPNKFTSINFSPFSYKGTYVPDTANIDQTRYGISANKKSKNEPGASFMILNEYKPFKNLTLTNRLQLFTNYINNPLNIDIDWEMIAVVNLNWFTDIKLNTHLIYDDDTKTPEFDKENNPVLGPDGLQKKTARVQFKEMLGISLVFRF